VKLFTTDKLDSLSEDTRMSFVLGARGRRFRRSWSEDLGRLFVPTTLLIASSNSARWGLYAHRMLYETPREAH